jgi:hypothetical protein
LLSHIADEGKDMIGRDILEQAIQMERDQIEEAYKSAILEHRIACVPVKIPATI